MDRGDGTLRPASPGRSRCGGAGAARRVHGRVRIPPPLIFTPVGLRQMLAPDELAVRYAEQVGHASHQQLLVLVQT